MGHPNQNTFSENEIEDNLKSRKALTFYRIRLLEEGVCDSDNAPGGVGLPLLFFQLLTRSIDEFVLLLSKNQILDNGNKRTELSDATETVRVLRILNIYRRICELDPILDEEIGKQGAHLWLSRIINVDIFTVGYCHGNDDDTNEANQDKIIEIQDLTCEIASFSKSFPLQASPFMREDLQARLPLVFNISPMSRLKNSNAEHNGDAVTILINQVTDRQSAQKDVGFVMWPSAVVLSRWLVSNPLELRGKTVLELGAGCGLTGLVAAKIIQNYENQNENKVSLSGAKKTASKAPSNSGCVVLSDFNETVVKNLEGNIGLNDLEGEATAVGLNFYQQDPTGQGWLTVDGVKRTDLADMILAADVICQPEDAFAAARSIASALREGCKALVVSADSKHRFGVEKVEEACRTVGSLSILSKTNVDDYLYDNDSVSRDEDMEKTSGFVHGMTLTMYTILKTSTR